MNLRCLIGLFPTRSGRASARFPSRTIPRRSEWTTKLINWLQPRRPSGTLPMHTEPTTEAIQRYLDALPGDIAAEPIIRELLARAVGRLRLLNETYGSCQHYVLSSITPIFARPTA